MNIFMSLTKFSVRQKPMITNSTSALETGKLAISLNRYFYWGLFWFIGFYYMKSLFDMCFVSALNALNYNIYLLRYSSLRLLIQRNFSASAKQISLFFYAFRKLLLSPSSSSSPFQPLSRGNPFFGVCISNLQIMQSKESKIYLKNFSWKRYINILLNSASIEKEGNEL